MKGWDLVFQGSQLEAEMYTGILRAAGFDAEMLFDTGPWPGASSQTGRVFVPADQAAAARERLRQGGEGPP